MSARISVCGQTGSVPLIRPVADDPDGPGGRGRRALGAPAVQAVREVLDGPDWQDDDAVVEEARAAQPVDVAHLAHLIDDLLDNAGVDDADRRAIADHLTGGRRLALDGDCHDSWMLTTALAQSWHAYSQRAQLSAGALLGILDGACGMVIDYVDAEAVARILHSTHEEVSAEQVAELIQWLERGDVWDTNVTAEQIRAAWARYRDRRHESAGAA